MKPLKMNPLQLARQALAPESASREGTEERRVLQLFRNRAELKKAYSELQDEIHRLKDRLKQQEGATARVQEILDHVEQRLGSADTGYPTMVFYQLRRLWSVGAGILSEFGRDLERQQLERERRTFLAEVNRRQFARRQQAEAQQRQAETEAADAAQRTLRLERERASLTRPWHHFKRKSVGLQLAAARATQSASEVALADSRSALEVVLSDGEVPFPGLSLDARRTVNLALIAYAEILNSRLTDSPLLVQARAAVLRREPSDEYGDRSECEALIAGIVEAMEKLEQRTSVGQEIKERTESLQKSAAYASAEDTIPRPETLLASAGDVMLRAPKGSRAPVAANVLAEDSWDIFRAMLR